MHPVVADLERVDPAALAFAPLQVDQELVGVLRQIAQFIEFGVVAGSQYTAITQHDGWVVDHRAGQQFHRLRVRADLAGERDQLRVVDIAKFALQRRQEPEAVAQRCEVAWPGAAQRDACQDAFDIADPAQHFLDRRNAVRIQQAGDGRVPCAHPPLITQRLADPTAQQTATHRRRGAVEQAGEALSASAGGRLDDLQIAPGRGVYDDRGIVTFDLQSGDMRQRAALGVGQILQQGAGRADRQWQIVAAKTAQVAYAELVGKQAHRCRMFEVPRCTAGNGTPSVGPGRCCLVFGDQDLCRRQAFQLAVQGFLADQLFDVETPTCQVEPGEPGDAVQP